MNLLGRCALRGHGLPSSLRGGLRSGWVAYGLVVLLPFSACQRQEAPPYYFSGVKAGEHRCIGLAIESTTPVGLVQALRGVSRANGYTEIVTSPECITLTIALKGESLLVLKGRQFTKAEIAAERDARIADFCRVAREQNFTLGGCL